MTTFGLIDQSLSKESIVGTAAAQGLLETIIVRNSNIALLAMRIILNDEQNNMSVPENVMLHIATCKFRFLF